MNIGDKFTVVPVPQNTQKQPSPYPALSKEWEKSKEPAYLIKPKIQDYQPIHPTPPIFVLPAGRIVQAAKWILSL